MSPVTVNICSNFSAAPGTPIIWTNIPPAGCTLTADGAGPWPFNIGPPIIFPMPSNRPITIKPGLPAGTYHFKASCCPNPITVIVA